MKNGHHYVLTQSISLLLSHRYDFGPRQLELKQSKICLGADQLILDFKTILLLCNLFLNQLKLFHIQLLLNILFKELLHSCFLFLLLGLDQCCLFFLKLLNSVVVLHCLLLSNGLVD